MKQQFQCIYLRMKEDVDNCRQLELPELEKVERCFRTVAGCWVHVKEALTDHHFANEEEEIDFFKNVKPLFTSQIEFYTLTYQGLLFKPETDRVKIESFWESESGRLQRFRENKEAFVQYYKSGDTSLDKKYFLRNSNDTRNGVTPKVYDKNADFSTSHDWLVAALMAHEMYHEYAKSKLGELGL